MSTNALRVQIDRLDVKEGVVDVARTLRGVEDERHVIIRAMAEIIAAKTTDTVETIWVAVRENLPRHDSNNGVSDLARARHYERRSSMSCMANW
jgi:hypothetical protein